MKNKPVKSAHDETPESKAEIVFGPIGVLRAPTNCDPIAYIGGMRIGVLRAREIAAEAIRAVGGAK